MAGSRDQFAHIFCTGAWRGEVFASFSPSLPLCNDQELQKQHPSNLVPPAINSSCLFIHYEHRSRSYSGIKKRLLLIPSRALSGLAPESALDIRRLQRSSKVSADHGMERPSAVEHNKLSRQSDGRTCSWAD